MLLLRGKNRFAIPPGNLKEQIAACLNPNQQNRESTDATAAIHIAVFIALGFVGLRRSSRPQRVSQKS
jgi:hypothetical protein